VLTFTLALEGFQSIPRRGAKKFQGLGGIQLRQLSNGNPRKSRKSSALSSLKQHLRIRATETADHAKRE
jgi:hypothetical protein